MARRWLNVILGVLSVCVLLGAGPSGVRASSPDATDVAWAAARAKIPPHMPVYRPTWLPARFQQQAPALVNYVGVPAVVYQRADSQLAFVFGGANSAAPTGSEAVMVHGMQGALVFSTGTPAIQVTWTEVGATYSVRGTKDVTRDELLRVVATLVPVGPDGRVVPGLPTTGAGGAWRAVARAGLFGVGAFLAVVGGIALLAARRSSGRPARPRRAALVGRGPHGGAAADRRVGR